jgi:hypothetical protein
MEKDPDGDRLVPIQEAAKEFSVSLASLYKYAARGQIRKYRRGFDRQTYVNRDEIATLAAPSEARQFVAEVPLDESDPLLLDVLQRLQERFPNRSWTLAGWGRFALVNGQRQLPYTALRYIAHHQRSVAGELLQVIDEVDPTKQNIDRYRVSLSEHPFPAESHGP